MQLKDITIDMIIFVTLLVACVLNLWIIKLVSDPIVYTEEVPYIIPVQDREISDAEREHICSLTSVICPEEEGEPTWTVRTVTAYTSRPEETDDTPCLSADGSNICFRHQEGERLCAANFVPFGTILMIDTSPEPDGQDAIVCTVADRTNSRFNNRVDLYYGYDLEAALNFGVQDLYVRQLDL